jgi:hypothetical protein
MRSRGSSSSSRAGRARQYLRPDRLRPKRSISIEQPLITSVSAFELLQVGFASLMRDRHIATRTDQSNVPSSFARCGKGRLSKEVAVTTVLLHDSQGTNLSTGRIPRGTAVLWIFCGPGGSGAGGVAPRRDNRGRLCGSGLQPRVASRGRCLIRNPWEPRPLPLTGLSKGALEVSAPCVDGLMVPRRDDGCNWEN